MKSLFSTVAIVCVLLGAQYASAQILPHPPQVETLDNGLKIVTLPWDSKGIVAYYTVVRTGSRDETDKGHTGFAERLVIPFPQSSMMQHISRLVKRRSQEDAARWSIGALSQ